MLFTFLRRRDVLQFSRVSKEHNRIFNLECTLQSILHTHGLSYRPTPTIHYPVQCMLTIRGLIVIKPNYTIETQVSSMHLKSVFLTEIRNMNLSLNPMKESIWKCWVKSLADFNHSSYLPGQTLISFKCGGYARRSNYLTNWMKTYIKNENAIRNDLKVMPALIWAHAPTAKIYNVGNYHHARHNCKINKSSVTTCQCEIARLLRSLYPGITDSDEKYSLKSFIVIPVFAKR